MTAEARTRDRLIKAAGGVVWRPSQEAADGVDVVLVHRSRYADWSLPKGKLDRGEKHRDAALREVREETGLTCELGPKLCTLTYLSPFGPKRVKWWAMRPVEGAEQQDPVDPTEISEVLWLPFEEAWERVSYGTDRQVLSAFVNRVLVPGGAV